MNLNECLIFCNENTDKIGTECNKGVISALIPAPIKVEEFVNYIKYYLQSDGNVPKAAVLSGAIQYEPLLLFKTPNYALVYSWYFTSFPNERLQGPQV